MSTLERSRDGLAWIVCSKQYRNIDTLLMPHKISQKSPLSTAQRVRALQKRAPANACMHQQHQLHFYLAQELSGMHRPHGQASRIGFRLDTSSRTFVSSFSRASHCGAEQQSLMAPIKSDSERSSCSTITGKTCTRNGAYEHLISLRCGRTSRICSRKVVWHPPAASA